MPTYFYKPETAINRAQQFLEVKKDDAALETLLEVLRSKKHRSEVQKLKEVIKEALGLCIKLQQSTTVKDSLYQFRNITSNVEPSAFNEAVLHFLDESEKKAAEAREQSQQVVLDTVEDLDQLMTPESLLLSTVSGEDTQSRTDRALLTPWLKFLWESYRNILDLVRNNKTFEDLYRDIARRTFKFCLEYRRHTEFRKLCEMFRSHLQGIQKAQPPTKDSYYISLTNPDSVICLVDIRFAQMHAAVSLDLWQEAFKAIEEVHNLFLLTSKHVKPKVWNQYYEKQAQVYWMANNRLFHAAALQRLLVLQKDQKKNMTPEEVQRLSSQVLLSTLAVPITPVQSDFGRFLDKDDIAREKIRKLTSLLRLPSPPTRNSLLQDLVRFGILQYVPTSLKQLYQYLEVEFDPLELCKRVLPILEGLPLPEPDHPEGEPEPVDLALADRPYNPPLGQYKEALKDVLLVRLIKQVAQVYRTISFARLQELAPFASAETLEKMVVMAARRNNLQVHIDHLSHSLHFGVDLSLNIKEDVPEGPCVQSMPAETVHMQLCVFSQALQQAATLLFAEEANGKLDKERQKARKMYLKSAEEDHRVLLARRKTIEDRKEYLESREKAKKKREEEEMKSKEQREREAEEERLQREKVEREKVQAQRDREEMMRKMQMERLENLKKTPVGARVLADIASEDLKNLSPDELFNMQLKRLEKEKQDQANQLKKQEKKIDYFERAKRLEEIPLLNKEYEAHREADSQFFEEQEQERIETAIKEREVAVETKKRLSKMTADRGSFMSVLKERRSKKLEAKINEFEDKLARVRMERLEERRKQRVAQRRAEYIEDLKEEKKKEEERREEEKKRRIEEQKQKQAEELAKLEEIRKKQLEREREIEEKQRRREEEQKASEPGPDTWRQRESGTVSEGHYLPPGRKRDELVKRDRDDRYPERSLRDDDRDHGVDDRWRGRDEDRDRGGEDRWRRRDDDRDRGGEDRWRRRDDDRDRGGDDRWQRRDDDRDRDDRWKRRDDDRERGDDRWRRRDDDRNRGDDRWRRRDDDRGGEDRWRRRDEDRDRGGDDRWRRRDDDRGDDRWRRRDDDRDRGDDRWKRRDDDRDRGDDRWKRRDDDRDRGDDRWKRRDDDRDRGDDRWRRRDDDRDRGDDRWRRRDDDRDRGDDRWKRRDDDRDRGDDRWRRRDDDRDRGDDRWRRRDDDRDRGDDRWKRRDDDRDRGDDRWKRRDDNREQGDRPRRDEGHDQWRPKSERKDDDGPWRRPQDPYGSPKRDYERDRARRDREGDRQRRQGDEHPRRDQSPRRKAEKQVDEEGFEIVRRR